MGIKKRDDYIQRFFSRPEDTRILCMLGNRGSGKKVCLHRLAKYSLIQESEPLVLTEEEVQNTSKGKYCRSFIYPYDDSEKLLQVISMPEFDVYNSEMYSMLLMCDGALVVLDCTKGVDSLLEMQIRKAFSFNLKCVLLLNKIDLLLENHAISNNEIYVTLFGIIESINMLISTCSQEEAYFHPLKGNVIFTSCLLNYAFTPRNFGKFYSRKYGIEESYFTNILWGDYFFDPRDKKTKLIKTNTPLTRSFCQFCIEPIRKVLKTLKEKDPLDIKKLCRTIRVSITEEDLEEGEPKLKKLIFKQWLRYTDSLLEGITNHCPSPISAQTNKFDNFYEGDLNDSCAVSMRDSSRRGPLMVYVSKLFPYSYKLLGLARVFSGVLNTGSRVRVILHSNDGESCFRYAEIKDIFVCINDNLINVNSVSVGNVIAIDGLENLITRSATLSDTIHARSIIVRPYHELPIFRATVSVLNASHLPRLLNRLKIVAKLEPLINIQTDDAGQFVVSAWTEQQLTDFIEALGPSLDTEITYSKIVMRYKETILKTGTICTHKSPNKSNKLSSNAEPLNESLATSIESGDLNLAIRNGKETSILHEDYEWSLKDLSHIWSSGPRFYGSNILVDTTKSIPFLTDVKDFIINSFQTVCSSGPLCNEEMRGVRMNLRDALLSSAPLQRGSGQIISAARKCFHASYLTATPALMEPICECNIICPNTNITQLYQTLDRREGKILKELHGELADYTHIQAYIPGSNLLQISEELSQYNSFITYNFSNWRIMSGDVLDSSSYSYDVMMSIRKWKGLKLELPRYKDTSDKA